MISLFYLDSEFWVYDYESWETFFCKLELRQDSVPLLRFSFYLLLQGWFLKMLSLSV